MEVEAFLATLAEPKWLVLANFHHVQPGVAGFFIGECENNVDLLEGAERSLWIEEVDERNDSEVCGGEDNPGAVTDVGKRDWGNEDDTDVLLV